MGVGKRDRLVPLTIFTEARDKKRIYWCRGLFTRYRIFSTGTKVVAADAASAATEINY